ncbi:PD-(D/E)XK nuclease family transposase [Eisenbergiella tayi]|uniref:PD-(D/E)XK nuclease family transposase n=1 Tax=Eisenbergiella tayi TaxID=1432052 RepID=A0A1E3A8W0_9FIRM|nr:PD-(D/E)XK nuclease family transposase [Eisenbergiella tayi]ODM04636.1 PD-(D/E)XK nuclease family transposase [Eisenbergiella tayi]
MANRLKDYFPLIRERKEVLEESDASVGLRTIFYSWEQEQREEFLDFCTGVKGVKILYDSFFKEIMNPEYAPGRLNQFLSLLIGEKVTIKQVIPNDSTRIAAEGSLLITDIVVEFEDGALADIEIQKIGYAFPGERSACYSADLLLRQYKRVREKQRGQKVKFSYKNIKNVYTIVIFEKSPMEIRMLENRYIHKSFWGFDTGLKMNLLQNFIFIALDIFRKNMENKTVENELDAWLMFFASEEPERIIELIESYPGFREIYRDIYEICLNMEKVMGMYSKELQELDRNTVQYMIDEMQETIDAQKQALNEQSETIKSQAQIISEQKRQYEELLRRVEKLEEK